MENLKTYLALCAKVGSKFDAFILEHGKQFEFDTSTFKGRRGKQGMCYMNATHKALAKPDLTYCEGYLLICGVPVHHAWCVNEHGMVIDPTIDNNNGRVMEYYGVPFTRDYLCEALSQNEVYGLLGYLSTTFRPLVEGKVNNFKESI